MKLPRAQYSLSVVFKAQPPGERAFYGISKTHMTPGLPPASPAHDPAYSRPVNAAGLAGPWRWWNEAFTTGGRWFLAASIALFMSGVNSLELQAYVPLLYVICFWLVAGALWFTARPKGALRAQHAERICAGETLPVELEVTNGGRGLAPEWRVLAHRLPLLIEHTPVGGAPLPPLSPGQSATGKIGLLCKRRGVYDLKGWRIETSYPFGLLSSGRVFGEPSRLLVFPSFTPLASLDVPSGRRHHPGGVALASQVADSFEFLGNREYREGDNPRDIDWRATARLQKPIVREYREEFFLRVAVVLDTHLPDVNEAAARDNFERAVSLCAAVGDFMARRDYLVDIFAAGPNLYHLLAGRSLAYLDQILDILACVDPNPDEPFETLEPEILENLAQINAIVCIFLDWNSARRAFCERLARSGAGIKILVVRDTPCSEEPLADTALGGEIPVITREQFIGGVTRL